MRCNHYVSSDRKKGLYIKEKNTMGVEYIDIWPEEYPAPDEEDIIEERYESMNTSKQLLNTVQTNFNFVLLGN